MSTDPAASPPPPAAGHADAFDLMRVGADGPAAPARLADLASDNASLLRELAGRVDAQHASEAQLRFATEAAAIGVWEISLPDMVLTGTPTLNAVYGLPPGPTPPYAEVRALAHPDDAARVLAAFTRATTGGADYHITYRVRHPDGHYACVEVRGQVDRGPDGVPVRILGVSQDVTVRHEAELRLELSEESLRLATDAAEVGTWDLDLTTDVLTWSDRTKAMFGISPNVPCSMVDFYAGLHPDDAPATAAAFAAATDPAVRAVYDVEYRTIGRGDGVVRWVAAKGKGLFDGDRCVRAIGTIVDLTGRRVAAERLRASEGRLAASEAFATLLLESTSEAFYSVDVDGVTTSCNAAFVTMLGFAGADAAIGRRLHDVIHHSRPDGSPYPVADCPIYRAAAGGHAAHVVDEVFHRLDGRPVPVEYRAEPIFRDGVRVGAICTIVDVTLRRADEARRRFTAALADRLLRTSDPREIVTIAVADLGRHLGVSRAGFGEVAADDVTVSFEADYVDGVASLVGSFPLAAFGVGNIADLRRGETTSFADVTGDDRTRDADFAAIETVAAAAVPLIRDGRLGALLYLHHREARAWPPSDLDLVRDVAARVRDAVERARAEAESRAIEARLHAVIEAAPVGLIFADPDGAVTGGNAFIDYLLRHPVYRSAGVADYSREWISFHADGRQVDGRDYPMARALAGEERPELEVLYRRGDGSDAYVRFVGAAIRGTDGAITGGVVAALDIDRERRAERALRDLNATLERRVEERTAELYAVEEALRQAQKMEAVGQLTGGIAHDFNNMLAVVLGSLDLLGRRLPPDDARARRYVDAALDGARRAATLTQRLLAFSRQQPLQPEPVDVNRLVAGMSDLLRGSLGGGVQLETVLAGGLWPVHADPNQLENILLNLGINARDAMAGEGRLTIETHNCHLDDRYVAAEIGVAAGQYVLIAVTDAGAGMPADVIARAFDPFFTTKGVGKGTGLGLSQVYGFVKQSGGHVKIYSEVGVGTTVKLYLPRLAGDVADTAASDESGTPVGGDGHELILVVEDEPGVRAISVEALRDLGYRVIEADGAAAALRLIEAHDVDLLFTDIVMPEMNGARLAEAARALRPGLRVLFTTGYTRNAVVHNGVVDAGVDLIGKPYTVDALAAKVRAVLDG